MAEFHFEQSGWVEAFAHCGNSTLGLIAFWRVGTRQQQGSAMKTIDALAGLPILDPRSPGDAGRAKAVRIFEEFWMPEFPPANEAYRDEARNELDRRVLVDVKPLRLKRVGTSKRLDSTYLIGDAGARWLGPALAWGLTDSL